MAAYKTFETDRLLIKPTDIEDAAFIFNLLNTPKWIEFIGNRNIENIEDAKKYIENKMLPQLHRLGFGNYTVILKSNKNKIGLCGLYDREDLDGIDIGFAFLPDFEGKGYALEAASKLLHIASTEFNLSQVSAITDLHNLASQNLIKKLGFKKVGLTSMSNQTKKLLLYKKIF